MLGFPTSFHVALAVAFGVNLHRPFVLGTQNREGLPALCDRQPGRAAAGVCVGVRRGASWCVVVRRAETSMGAGKGSL